MKKIRKRSGVCEFGHEALWTYPTGRVLCHGCRQPPIGYVLALLRSDSVGSALRTADFADGFVDRAMPGHDYPKVHVLPGEIPAGLLPLLENMALAAGFTILTGQGWRSNTWGRWPHKVCGYAVAEAAVPGILNCIGAWCSFVHAVCPVTQAPDGAYRIETPR